MKLSDNAEICVAAVNASRSARVIRRCIGAGLEFDFIDVQLRKNLLNGAFDSEEVNALAVNSRRKDLLFLGQFCLAFRGNINGREFVKRGSFRSERIVP